jgi:glycosyltransferase involved in cell wall biosynthesis
MAMAKPVVAPRYQPIEAIITQDVDGLLFEANNRESLKMILAEAMADPEKRRRLGVAARQNIMERHTWRHNAKRVIDLVQK